ncbi:MAG: LCP family protein, partial [Chloroflexota bacterium]|nr:LCP family protein [Chloroflexota bacterium]
MPSTSTARPVSYRRALRSVLALCVAALLVVALWFGLRFYHVYQGIQKITSQAVPRSTFEPKATPAPFDSNKRINFLILGSDNDRKKEAAKPDTQSMIVVTLDPKHHRVDLLSIPRDFYVPIRGHGKDKIMLAFKYGAAHGDRTSAVLLARETVERAFRIRIDHYVWIGLDGFIGVINTFGGVTLDIKHPVLDDFYPDDLSSVNPYVYRRIFIPAGWQHMTGDRALQYVRSRHGDLIGDLSREGRQQQVLLEVHRRINALDVLLNIESLVSELQGKVMTDLTLPQIYDLNQMARHIGPQDIHQVVLQYPQYARFSTAITPAGEQSILIPNWSRIRPLVKQIFAEIPQDHIPPNLSQGRPRVAPTSTPTPRPAPSPTATSRPGETPTAVASPTPVPSATPPTLARLPGHLIVVQGRDIVEINPDHSTRTLATLPGATMLSPSPDSHTIALAQFLENSSDLWTLDVRTGHLRRLTYSIDPMDVHNDLWSAWPTWMRDGKTLLFSTDRAKLPILPSERRSVDLAVWSLSDRGALAQLTQPQPGSGGDTEPAVRPGTSQFAYVRWDYLKPSYQPYSQLELKDLTTGGIWNLTPRGGRILQPQWNRSGTKLVYIRRAPNGQDQIVVAALERARGGPQLGPRTFIAGGRVAQPAFSPDGRWISYLRASTSGFDLYIEPVIGGQAVKVDEAGSG